MTKKYDIPKFTRYDPTGIGKALGLTAAKNGEYISVKQLRAALRSYWHTILDQKITYSDDEDDPMTRQFMDKCDAKAATAKHFLDMIDGD